MNYIEVQFELIPLLPAREVLYGDLTIADFESFEDTESGVKAYIQESQFDEDKIKAFNVWNIDNLEVKYNVRTIEQKNWNAVWESNFEPIIVNDDCVIRAPFHDSFSKKNEIIISPQMSFGTGHHETTFLMAQQLFALDLEGKTLLDMGCGTAVLAILAHQLGAVDIVGIDIEDWAYQNALENCALNNTTDIIIEKGDSKLLDGRSFQIILANINKNVLINDMSRFAESLANKGSLLLSGFFDTDVKELIKVAADNGLKYVSHNTKNNWAMMILEK